MELRRNFEILRQYELIETFLELFGMGINHDRSFDFRFVANFCVVFSILKTHDVGE